MLIFAIRNYKFVNYDNGNSDSDGKNWIFVIFIELVIWSDSKIIFESDSNFKQFGFAQP